MAAYGPQNLSGLSALLTKIEEGVDASSQSSNFFDNSINQIVQYRNSFSQEWRQNADALISTTMQRWIGGRNAQLKQIAKSVQQKLQIVVGTCIVTPVIDNYVPKDKVESELENSKKTFEEVGRKRKFEEELEQKHTIFEEYRRLSYDLNKPEKIDGHRITKIDDYTSIVQAPDNNGILKEYYAKRVMTTNDDLVPFILVPVDQSETPCEVRLTFQGTSSLNGWYRNFTGKKSAGINEFMKNKTEMIKQLTQEISKIQGDVNLSIVGHSLGGADSQNMMVAVMDSLDKTNHLNNVKKVSLYAYNSAGVSEQTREESLDLAAKLSAKSIGIEANFAIVGGDVVQQTGDTNILVGMPANHGTFTLVKTIASDLESEFNAWRPISSGYRAAFKTLDAHVGQFFTEGREKSLVKNREFYVNDNDADAKIIEEKLLQHKLAQKMPLSYTIGQNLKGGLKVMGQYAWEGSARDLANLVENLIEHANELSDEAVVRQIDDILWLDRSLLALFFAGENNFFIECAKRGKNDIAKKLCEYAYGYGIKENDYLDRKNSEGMTALHYAARNGNTELVELLRGSKVSRAIEDSEGNTILHYYARNRLFSAELFVNNLFVELGLSSGGNATSPNVLLKAGESKNNALVDCIINAGRLDIIDAILEKDNALRSKQSSWAPTSVLSWGAKSIGYGRGEEPLTRELRQRLEEAKIALKAAVPAVAPRRSLGAY